MSKLSRRALLSGLGAGALASRFPMLLHNRFGLPDTSRVERLATRITSLLSGEEIGFELRGWDRFTNREMFRVQINPDRYFPVASCFKVLVVLYYFWHTPRDLWRYDEESDAYRVAVFSNNVLTGSILEETAQYITTWGNAIQKFNIFLNYTLGIASGLYRWDWPGSPTTGQVDLVMEPTAERHVIHNGQRYDMDNLFTATDLADTYALLLQENAFPQYPQAREAILMTKTLFSIPAPDYQAPLERSFGRYVGKDGVIPAEDSKIGRIVNDAGIVRVLLGTYILTALYTAGEFSLISLLREVRTYLLEYELS